MIDLSYRPRLTDLQPLTRSNFGLQLFEPEGVRTSEASAFHGREGYDEDFLPGFGVPLPDTMAIAGDVSPVPESDGSRLDYEHFSVLMSKSRRLALFSTVNIDGSTNISTSRYRAAEIRRRSTAAFPKRLRRGDEEIADVVMRLHRVRCG